MRILLAIFAASSIISIAHAKPYDFKPEGSGAVFQQYVKITNALETYKKLLDISNPSVHIQIFSNPNALASYTAFQQEYRNLISRQYALAQSLAQNFLYEQMQPNDFLAVSYRAGWVDGSPHSLANTSAWLKQEYGIVMKAAAINKATDHAQINLVQGTLYNYLKQERGNLGHIADKVSGLDFTVEQHPKSGSSASSPLRATPPPVTLPTPLLQQPSTHPTSLSTPTPYPFLIQQTASPATYLPSTSFYQPSLIVAPTPVPAIPFIR